MKWHDVSDVWGQSNFMRCKSFQTANMTLFPTFMFVNVKTQPCRAGRTGLFGRRAVSWGVPGAAGEAVRMFTHQHSETL